jgi:hypothetical protein
MTGSFDRVYSPADISINIMQHDIHTLVYQADQFQLLLYYRKIIDLFKAMHT